MMDKERAIEELELLKGECGDDWLSPKQYDDRVLALDMAIKSLEQEPCEDAMSRVDLIDKLEIVDKRYGSDFYWEVRKIIDSLPSVKPVHKTGKWENKSTNGHYFYGKCSKCGQEFCVDTWYTQNIKYCSNCGARMENN